MKLYQIWVMRSTRAQLSNDRSQTNCYVDDANQHASDDLLMPTSLVLESRMIERRVEHKEQVGVCGESTRS